MVVKEYVAVLGYTLQRHYVQFCADRRAGRFFDVSRYAGRTMFQNDIVRLFGGYQIRVLDDEETPNPSLNL